MAPKPMTGSDAARIQSSEAKASGTGGVEKGSFAARAQVRRRPLSERGCCAGWGACGLQRGARSRAAGPNQAQRPPAHPLSQSAAAKHEGGGAPQGQGAQGGAKK